MERQQGGCAICDVAISLKTAKIDHDHACDHPDKGSYSCKACVRGLLCHPCNVFLGYLEPRQHLVERALEYAKGLDWESYDGS
jgi:hypothetical protein